MRAHRAVMCDRGRLAQCRPAAFAWAICWAIASLLMLPVALQAQDYPNRPVRIIVPFPAGGTADVMPRIVADWLSRKWGQAVIIENKAGAAGNIGAGAGANSAPNAP